MRIRICSIGGTSVMCSPLIIIAAVFGLIFGMGQTLLVSFLSLTLHEASHSIMAHRLGAGVASIEIQPFGFVARLKKNISIPCSHELAIASAGPVFSFVAGCAAAFISGYLPEHSAILDEFVRFNITIGIINLMPALPLDGGRMLRSVLEKITHPRRALLISIWHGIILSTALVSVGIYLIINGMLNITILIMGIFTFISAISEFRSINSVQMGAMLKRNDTLHRGIMLPLRHTALNKNVSAADALRSLSFNRYNIIVVVDENMSRLGDLDETQLMTGLARSGETTIGELLQNL